MPNPDSGVHVSIDEHEITIDEYEDISIDLLNFSPAKQADIKHLSSTYPVIKTLSEIIYGGWHETSNIYMYTCVHTGLFVASYQCRMVLFLRIIKSLYPINRVIIFESNCMLHTRVLIRQK